jgi:hypothetical protein
MWSGTRALTLAIALAQLVACSALTPFGDFRLAHDAARDASRDVAPDAPPPDVTIDAPFPDVPSPDVPSPDVPSPDVPSPDVPSPDVAPDSTIDVSPDVGADATAEPTLDAPPDLPEPDVGPLDVPVVDLPPACPAGQQRCGDVCVNLATSLDHCGVCGSRCAPPDASAACIGGRCVITGCGSRRADCNGVADDGCEADLRLDVANCGSCGFACGFPNGVAECRGGTCALSRCEAGFGDCDGNTVNGCETDLNTRVDRCGACATSCVRPFTVSNCVGGRCDEGVCMSGRGDCDGDPRNGCETDTLQNLMHCGACRAPCGAGQVCAGGRCQSCAAGTADCNGDNTCETNLDLVTSCGACGRACVIPNATPSCAARTCRIAACNPGFADCDGVVTNGCEVSLATSLAHCGACGRACNAPNATSMCAAGNCRVAACPSGRADCNGAYLDGCEVSLVNNPAHCGACNNQCPTGFCRGTECVSFGGLLSAADHPACAAINTPNPYTATYGCGPGTTATAYRRIIDCPAGAFTGATTYVCGRPGAVSTYAGAFEVVSCGGAAVCIPNPYTGGCACPGGTFPTAPMNLYSDGPGCGGLHAAQMVFCMRGLSGAGFGGAWQRRDDGACLVPNPLASGCACPPGFGAVGLRVITPPPIVYGATIAVCVR